MKARWAENETTIGSLEELRSVIETVRRSGEPTIMFLDADNETILWFGVGRDESVLGFFDADGSSWHSLGTPYRRGTLTFHNASQVDDFDAELAVPYAHAVEAAERFLATAERPTNIIWEADWDEGS